MSTSVLESILPLLVIVGFLGVIYFCAFGFLIVACHRLHRFEKNRAWQIAWFATLIHGSLTCLVLAIQAIKIFRLANGSIDFDFAEEASVVMGHAGSIAHLTVLTCLAIALLSPLLNEESPKTTLPESQAE